MTDELLKILGLIAAHALFTLSEYSFESARRNRLEHLAKKGSALARIALSLGQKRDRMLFSIQAGYGLILLLIGVSFGNLLPELENMLFPRGLSGFSALATLAAGLLGLGFVFLLFGIQIPRKLAQRFPENLAPFLAPLVRAWIGVTSPAFWMLSGISDWLLRLFGWKPGNGDNQVTEEEVIELIAQGTHSGTIEELEQDMMERVLLLGDRNVASLMTNRVEVEWFDLQTDPLVVLDKIAGSNHTLFPVCDGELDKIQGVLSSKKFLVALKKNPGSSLRDLMDPVRVVPENMKALTALEEFKASKAKIAVVVDEYGSVQGLLTQSDLFEAIVAEHDIPDDQNETAIVQRDENSWLVDALLPFDEFLQYFEIDDVEAEDRAGFHSLAGFILHLSRQIPHTGDRFIWKNYEFEVVDMDGNRIDKVIVTIREEGVTE